MSSFFSYNTKIEETINENEKSVAKLLLELDPKELDNYIIKEKIDLNKIKLPCKFLSYPRQNPSMEWFHKGKILFNPN
jgi:hypothetical protein